MLDPIAKALAPFAQPGGGLKEVFFGLQVGRISPDFELSIIYTQSAGRRELGGEGAVGWSVFH